MIDHMDKQTQPMDLEQKRGRGRPATGQALSNADRQRAYRERQKAQRNEKGGSPEWEDVRKLTKYIDDLGEQLAEAINRAQAAEAKAKELETELREAQMNMADNSIRTTARIRKLEEELSSRNEKELKEGKFPGTWVVERKERNTRTWKKSGGVVEESWDAAKGSVDYMQFTSGTGQDHTWRARCTAGTFKGMIYQPKAPK